MIDPDQYEQEAIDWAAQQGGEFLDALDKTDLAAMTVEEWKSFVAVICGCYTDKLGEIAGKFEQEAAKIKKKVAHDAPAAA